MKKLFATTIILLSAVLFLAGCSTSASSSSEPDIDIPVEKIELADGRWTIDVKVTADGQQAATAKVDFELKSGNITITRASNNQKDTKSSAESNLRYAYDLNDYGKIIDAIEIGYLRNNDPKVEKFKSEDSKYWLITLESKISQKDYHTDIKFIAQ